MNKKFYLIYKITNNLNQKFYIGKHETDNLDDDYFGSGKYLINAQNKYGLENFTKTILFYCHNQEEMNLLEHCAVTPEFCQREDVYNIMEGGNGGWDYVNLSSDYGVGSEKRRSAALKSNNNKEANIQRRITFSKNWKLKTSDELDIISKNISNGVRQHKIDFPDYMAGENNPMFGYKWSDQQKQNLSVKHLANKNSMFKAKWIHHSDLKLSFPVSEELFWVYIGEGWRKGRVLNWDNYITPEQRTELKQKQIVQNILVAEDRHKIKVELLRQMYNEFKVNEFQGVVKKFCYQHTRNALIMAFKAFIPEYIPKTCNRWKNRTETHL